MVASNSGIVPAAAEDLAGQLRQSMTFDSSLWSFTPSAAAIAKEEFVLEAVKKPKRAQFILASYEDWLGEAELVFERQVLPIPSLYRQELLPSLAPNPRSVEKVLSHAVFMRQWHGNTCVIVGDECGPGVLACGNPRTAKTRTIYALLIRLALVGGVGFEAVRANDLQEEVSELALHNPTGLRELRQRLCRTNVLFIDDLHQGKFTPRYAQFLFGVVEARTSEEMPIYVTCQMPAGRLIEKWSADNPEGRETAEAIVGRLREFCVPVDFNPAVGPDEYDSEPNDRKA